MSLPAGCHFQAPIGVACHALSEFYLPVGAIRPASASTGAEPVPPHAPSQCLRAAATDAQAVGWCLRSLPSQHQMKTMPQWRCAGSRAAMSSGKGAQRKAAKGDREENRSAAVSRGLADNLAYDVSPGEGRAMLSIHAANLASKMYAGTAVTADET